MFLLYPTCLFLALRFSHLQPVITNVVNNLAVPKENTVTSENLDVDIAAKNCTEIPGGGRGVLRVSSDGDDGMGEKNKFGFTLLTELLGRDMWALPPIFRLF